MLVFVMVSLATFVCNLGQGQCIYVGSDVMNGLIAAGVIEIIFEGMFGLLKIYRKKDNDDE